MNESIIMIVSDSVGDTAETFAKAALIQFSDRKFHLIRRSFVDDLEKVDDVVEEALQSDALIVFTLIKQEMRAYICLRAKEKSVTVYDVFGNFIETLEKKYHAHAAGEFGLIHRLDAEYFRKIDAVEFAVKYDDGRDPSGILKADIVLIGISRTSKTPLSQHLAHKGYKVANVPIVPEVEPPEELFTIDSTKCIGLISSPSKLNDVRKERLKSLGLDDSALYADMERIQEELDYFGRIANKLNCVVVDVSNKAIEETANRIEQIISSY